MVLVWSRPSICWTVFSSKTHSDMKKKKDLLCELGIFFSMMYLKTVKFWKPLKDCGPCYRHCLKSRCLLNGITWPTEPEIIKQISSWAPFFFVTSSVPQKCSHSESGMKHLSRLMFLGKLWVILIITNTD